MDPRAIANLIAALQGMAPGLNPNWQSPGARGPQVLNPGLSLRGGNLPPTAQLMPGPRGPSQVPQVPPVAAPRPRPMPFRPGGKSSLIAEILRGGGVPRSPAGESAAGFGRGIGRLVEGVADPLQTDAGPSPNEPSLADASALGAPGEDTGDAAIWEFALSQPDLLQQAAGGGMTSAQLLEALRSRQAGRSTITPGNPGFQLSEIGCW